jgi:hypothetical protein
MDALGKVCDCLREKAKELGFGTLFLPDRVNPGIIVEVHNGQIKQVEIHYPEKTVKYRAD